MARRTDCLANAIGSRPDNCSTSGATRLPSVGRLEQRCGRVPVIDDPDEGEPVADFCFAVYPCEQPRWSQVVADAVGPVYAAGGTAMVVSL